MSLQLSNKAINKYFRFLSQLDNKSKKRLIERLNESMEVKRKLDFGLRDLFGAWEDSRNSDEIIKDISGVKIENWIERI